MSQSPAEPPDERPAASGFWIALGLLVLVAGGFLSYAILRRAEPPPAAIAADPLLSLGREVYQSRCASCHGDSGRGDGPIAKNLQGPPVGDLTDDHWKHGSRPDQIRAVVERGVKDTAMSGWKGMISDRQLNASVAYVEYLAGRRQPVAAILKDTP